MDPTQVCGQEVLRGNTSLLEVGAGWGQTREGDET